MKKLAKFSFEKLPVWVQTGGMVKKVSPNIMKEKNQMEYLEAYSNAQTLCGVVQMIYEQAIDAVDEKLEKAVKQKNGFQAKEYAEIKTILKKDEKWVKKLYAAYADIAIVGFDFNRELDEYTKEIQTSIKNKTPLTKMPTYEQIRPLKEYIETAHSILFTLSQMEERFQLQLEEIKTIYSADEFHLSHLMDQEEFVYAFYTKKMKEEWGSISSALRRSIAGEPTIIVTKLKEAKLNLPEMTTKDVYKESLRYAKKIRVEVRKKENKLYAKTRLQQEETMKIA